MKRVLFIVLFMLSVAGVSSAFAQTGAPSVATRSPYVEDPALAPQPKPIKAEKDGMTANQADTDKKSPAANQRNAVTPTENRKKVSKKK